MRINQYVAMATGLSRRKADDLIEAKQVSINGQQAQKGAQVLSSDTITLTGKLIKPVNKITILLNKPVGYVCSRKGQGSKTIYDLLPDELYQLKPIGRLDKDSSGLLLMTNDGKLANQLTHPSFKKEKVYEVRLNKALALADKQAIETGVRLEDGPSRLKLLGNDKNWTITMSEGRNRQIRRTFQTLGYTVKDLNRVSFDNFSLEEVKQGEYLLI